MEIEDLKDWWIFDKAEDLIENCELQCPECGEWSSHKEYTESIVYCEDCGEHKALQCPKCDERFDHVWSKTFRVKNNQ